jgi:hypothetical protein
MIKSKAGKGKARITFTVDPQVGAQVAAVCGDWNGWSPGADVMRPDGEGGFSLTVELAVGRAYRFRYLLDGHRWENDWAADAYKPNDFGADDSVVDLTALPAAARRVTPEAPTARKAPASTKAPVKKEAVKNETAAPARRKTSPPAKSPKPPKPKA